MAGRRLASIPAIHASIAMLKFMDARDKPGHDEDSR